MGKEKIIEENKKLCERYPFLIPRNRWTGEIAEDFDYSWTELDDMPDGWRKAFGEQMCEEIREELVKHNFLDKYRILEIKEKYSSLRWYDFGYPNDSRIPEIIDKYESLSTKTCIKCGSNNKVKFTDGWIVPLCDKCMTKYKEGE